MCTLYNVCIIRDLRLQRIEEATYSKIIRALPRVRIFSGNSYVRKSRTLKWLYLLYMANAALLTRRTHKRQHSMIRLECNSKTPY